MEKNIRCRSNRYNLQIWNCEMYNSGIRTYSQGDNCILSKKAYNNVVLVNDRTELSDKLVIENPTFEEIMNMFVKGKRI